jgi:hypothetical protein
MSKQQTADAKDETASFPNGRFDTIFTNHQSSSSSDLHQLRKKKKSLKKSTAKTQT